MSKKGSKEVPNGKGNIYFNNGCFFNGVFVDGFANGPGKMIFPNGSYY